MVETIWDNIYFHTISAEEIIQKINSGENIYLNDFVIYGDIDLRMLVSDEKSTSKTINSRIFIINSAIYGSIYFADYCFNKPVEIKDTKIWGSVDFTKSKLKSYLYFDDTIIIVCSRT